MLPIPMQLLPRLARQIEQVRSIAEARGIHTVVPRDGGVRSSAEQQTKFEQGRHLINGIWVPDDLVGHRGIVTNAPPCKAPHCLHLDHDLTVGSAACDVAIVCNEKVAWKKGDPGFDLYPALGKIGQGQGLEWGGAWIHLADLDHFELSDFRSLTLAPELP